MYLRLCFKYSTNQVTWKLIELDKMHDEGEAALESVDWDADDEGDM
jgi:hypothetical protein